MEVHHANTTRSKLAYYLRITNTHVLYYWIISILLTEIIKNCYTALISAYTTNDFYIYYYNNGFLNARKIDFGTFCSFAIRLFLQVIIIMTCVQWDPPTLDIFNIYEYPDWAHGLGWLIVMTPLIFIPAIFVIVLFKEGGVEVSLRSLLYCLI